MPTLSSLSIVFIQERGTLRDSASWLLYRGGLPSHVHHVYMHYLHVYMYSHACLHVHAGGGDVRSLKLQGTMH